MAEAKSKKADQDVKSRKAKKADVRHAGESEAGTGQRQGWIPKGEILEFAGRSIPGMVYFGTPAKYHSKWHGERESGVYIDPALEVAEKGMEKGKRSNMMYSYAKLNPNRRADYLDWLATGKSDATMHKNYPLLYFFGLERRYLLDDPDEKEKEEIIEEVKRLQRVCTFFEGIGHHFYDFINSVTWQKDPVKRHWDSDKEDHKRVLRMLGNLKKAAAGDSLGVEACMEIVRFAIETELTELDKSECTPWLLELFRRRFPQGFPNGWRVKKPDTFMMAEYHASSMEFTVYLPYDHYYSPRAILRNIKSEIADLIEFACRLAPETAAHSKFVWQSPEGADGLTAMELLPMELQDEFRRRSPVIRNFTGKMEQWTSDRSELGQTAITADDILNIANETKLDSIHAKLDWEESADVLASFGYGAAPDFELNFRSVKPDDPAVVFELDCPGEFRAGKSDRYRDAVRQVSIATFVFKMEKRSFEESAEILKKTISEIEELSVDERKGLMANLKCAFIRPHNRGFLKRVEKETGDGHRNVIRSFLVRLANEIGNLKTETVSAIEKVYAALGIDPASVYSDLHSGEVATVANPGNGHDADAAVIDESRIHSIRRDTDDVSSMLGRIFEENAEAGPVPGESGDVSAAGLDSKHTALLQRIVERTHWTSEDFKNLADGFGIMPEGAVETINECFFEQFGVPLLEEDDGYRIAPDALAKAGIAFHKSNERM